MVERGQLVEDEQETDRGLRCPFDLFYKKYLFAAIVMVYNSMYSVVTVASTKRHEACGRG
jgi:hypothetical protein